LYLIHWPVAHQYKVARPEAAEQFLSLAEVPLHETWQGMLECVDAGLCKHAGVANFSTKKIDGLIEKTGQVPECNQVESHPLLQQQELVEYCQEKQIAFVAYSPLGSGGRPDMLKKDDEPNLFEIPEVVSIAQARGVTPAEILLAWAVNRGTAAIPKSTNVKRQRMNLDAVEIELTEDEIGDLSTLDAGYRFVDGTFWECEGGPYTVAELWD
jgi:alcohol dehydrogenase (NADP+)